jgi:hypothetical protein
MRPRLSIVVPVRDAAYGGGLVHRAQVCLNAILTPAAEYGLECEVIFVEWNPVDGAPRFRDLLFWPQTLGPAAVRFIEVPASVHEGVRDAHCRPFHSATARNVGVRRAAGEYILVTGADALPSDSLMEFLAHEPLLDRAFYRIDRRDLPEAVPAAVPVGQQLAFSNGQDITLHTFYGSIRESGNPTRLDRIRTRRRHHAVLKEYRKYEANPIYGGRKTPFSEDRPAFPPDGLHRNGAGDFFLMHRDRWHELRGYTELPTRGHTDSILCWTAASADLEQVILESPLQLFHQHHDRYGVADWPVTDWRPWYARYLECRQTGTPLIENESDWGLRDADLPEWTFADRQPE